MCELIVLSVRLPVNSKLSVKFLGSQKFKIFFVCVGDLVPLTLMFFRGQLYLGSLIVHLNSRGQELSLDHSSSLRRAVLKAWLVTWGPKVPSGVCKVKTIFTIVLSYYLFAFYAVLIFAWIWQKRCWVKNVGSLA